MGPVVWGVAAAVLWGFAAVAMARPARALGARMALAWMMITGSVIMVPLALVVDGRPSAEGSGWAWAGVAGLAFVTGSLAWMLAVRRGNVSIVTPIMATDGALAAGFAILTGEPVRTLAIGALAVVAVGVVVASVQPGVPSERATPVAAVGLALTGAVLFAVVFTAGGRTGALGALWAVAVTRVVGAVVSLPLGLRGRVPPRDIVPWLVGATLLDSLGYACVVQGASDGVAITSVLASQYAVIAVIGGVLLYGERLARTQLVGVALMLAGVAAVAISRL